MKTLIAEDDFTCRNYMQEILSRFGTVHAAANGKEAVEAVRQSIENGSPYDLICLDILMPEMDGQVALAAIRRLEEDNGYRNGDGAIVFMTTMMKDLKSVNAAYHSQCDAYLIKPVDAEMLYFNMRKVGLLD